MANIDLMRKHHVSFDQARTLAQSWVQQENTLFLEGKYIHGDDEDRIVFQRPGVSGVLVVTPTHFMLDVELGFLFSAYRQRIIDTINANMDELLGPE